MRWICILGLFIGCIGIFWWRNYQKEIIISFSGKNYVFLMDSFGLKIGEMLIKDNHLKRSQIRYLYPLTDVNEVLYRQRIYTGRMVICIWMGIHMLGIVFSFAFQENFTIHDNAYIMRSMDDGISETVTASASGESFRIEDFAIEVRDQLLEGENKNSLFIESEQMIRTVVKGENSSLDCINQKLNLISSIPGTSMKIIWGLEDADYIYSDGNVDMEKVPQQGINQVIHVTLSYGTEIRNFDIQVFLCPVEKTVEQLAREEIESYVAAENAVHNNESKFSLPAEILGEKVHWHEKKSYIGEKTLLLIVIIVLCSGIYYSKMPERNLKKRQEQLITDYPKFIHKLVLLTEAGMNMRSALDVIVSGQQNHSQDKMHYVYKEAAVVLRMMKSGVSEIKAYENFGKQCQDSMYIKLSMLMIQWVKKGALGTGELMQSMAQEAMLLRKDQMKQHGEKIGTKLLVPMGLILVVVFMILVVPAFLSLEL